MDDEDIIHWHNLIREYKRHLRLQEEKVAGYGKLECPPYIIKGIEDTNRQIDILEQKIRARIRHADDNGRLFTNEEIDLIYNKWVNIFWYEDDIKAYAEYIMRLQKVFYESYLLRYLLMNRIEIYLAIIILSLAISWFIDGYAALWYGIMFAFTIVFVIWNTFRVDVKIKAAKKKIREYQETIEEWKRELERMRKGGSM